MFRATIHSAILVLLSSGLTGCGLISTGVNRTVNALTYPRGLRVEVSPQHLPAPVRQSAERWTA